MRSDASARSQARRSAAEEERRSSRLGPPWSAEDQRPERAGATAEAQPQEAPLLTVEHLRIEFATSGGWLPVVEDVGFSVCAGPDTRARGGERIG